MLFFCWCVWVSVFFCAVCLVLSSAHRNLTPLCPKNTMIKGKMLPHWKEMPKMVAMLPFSGRRSTKMAICTHRNTKRTLRRKKESKRERERERKERQGALRNQRTHTATKKNIQRHTKR